MHALPPPRVALVPNAIAFRDPSHGVLGTGWQSCAANRAFRCKPQGTISLTSDGGKTWRVVLRTPRPVVWVSWSQGISARFDDGENVQSTNGGRTWAPFVAGYGQFNVACPQGTQQVPNNFQTGDWSLCTNQPGAGNQGKSVYELKPHGWVRVAYTPFPYGHGGYGGISTYGYPEGLAMASDGFGLIWEWRGTLYVTRDGGSHWVGLTKVAHPEVDFGMSGYALRHGIGFVILASGGTEKRRLLETTDAGRTWHVVKTWT